jgi:predicted nucleic acid-binding protein
MDVLIGTSALVAVVDRTDRFHQSAADTWRELVSGPDRLVSTSYLLVEAYPVLQGRFGMGLVQAVASRYEPLLTVEWIDKAVHQKAAAAYLTSNRRGLSLVDCVSFAVMRQLGIRRAFTLDPHFAEQGFEVISEALPGT